MCYVVYNRVKNKMITVQELIFVLLCTNTHQVKLQWQKKVLLSFLYFGKSIRMTIKTLHSKGLAVSRLYGNKRKCQKMFENVHPSFTSSYLS